MLVNLIFKFIFLVILSPLALIAGSVAAFILVIPTMFGLELIGINADFDYVIFTLIVLCSIYFIINFNEQR